MKHSALTTFAAVTCTGTLALTACGADGGADGGEQDVTLSMTWWGADYRNNITNEMIDICEEEAGITVDPQHSAWEGYWDQLATQTAGNNTPDIMQMDDTYIREYADRGLLLDLDQVDVSTMEEDAIANGATEDGQVGITTGINVMAMLANPEIFDELGMELPDDSSWTWDDYRELVIDISEQLEGQQFGAGGPVEPVSFQLWLRQNGQNLTTDDGEVGFEPEDLEEYWEFQLELIEDGGYPNATLIQEESNAQPGESMFEIGEQALARYWSNQLTGVTDVSGVEMVPLRWPSATGNSAENGLWYKSTMLWSAAAATDHPDEAQAFIDCLVNNEEAGVAQGMDRGLPANQEVREVVREGLEGSDLVAAEFLDTVDPDVEAQEPEPVPAMGASAIQDILGRYSEEVFFESMTPEEAAEAAHTEAVREVGE